MARMITVDFDGSHDEALAYAAMYGMTAPGGEILKRAQRASGCSVLAVPYTNDSERAAAIELFEALGWEDCWSDD